VFTSNLTVNDFALGVQERLQPLRSVMGTCFVQVGWQNRPYSGSAVLRSQTDALNQARRVALQRLFDEAKAAGADAVVEVRIRRGSHDFAAGAIEFIAQGTAVRDPQHPRQAPVLTDVSVADLHRLRLAGCEPVGLVAASTVYYVVPSWSTRNVQRGWMSSWRNQELPEFTQGVYTAREIALEGFQREAEAVGADGVVGVDLRHEVRTRESGSESNRRTDLIITFEVLGTAIRTVREPGLAVMPTIPMGARRP
jgi:uncharacterized protein YbjQ (UPF0145 family)